jgi:hypothetical protein
MWVKPGWVPEGTAQRTAAPPQERGELLLTLPRNFRDQHEQLRLALDQYEGRKYLSLRIWNCDHRGEWWPTPRGVSIRLSEVAALAEALAKIADEQPQRSEASSPATSGSSPRKPPPRATTPGERPPPHARSGSRRGPQRDHGPRPHPEWAPELQGEPPKTEFDEFHDGDPDQ